ncbi:hypothetical protein F5I97DRAFT_1906441 [Phlebopus sp. FC_14]|nr:hypothetical protein F5I97DRAFT_1906441 [Phlebopus sp. FC_14]
MAEQHPMPRSPSQSFIPVVTPRPPRASISNAFPVSQASLAPQQPRRTSESSTQASPASTSVSLCPQTPVSTMSSFRSFRNLLPFGPGRSSNAVSASPVNNTQKPYFAPFGSLRRSVTNERKTSATLNRPDDPETFPVIAIARSSENFEEEMMAHKRSRDLVRSSSDVPSSPVREESYVLPAPSPGPPLGADLSTIIEVENSGISRHIACTDDSTHPDETLSPPTSPFELDRIDKRIPSPDSRNASMLDLSTSKLNAEVMDALMVKDATTASEWLKGVNGVVGEGADDPPNRTRGVQSTSLAGKNGEQSLDLGALDPDLAELLSPHRVNDKSNVSSALDGLRAHSRSPSHPVVPSPCNTSTERDDISQETPSPRIGSVIPPSPASRAVAQSSPTRRTVSLSRSNLARPPASSLPRLMRSVTTAPASATKSSPEESSVAPGLRGPQVKRHQPSSPLSSQPHSSPPGTRGFTDLPMRRPATSRFATPNRHVSSYTPSNSRPADPLIPPESGSASPVSQVSSRTASDHRRQPPSQPSLELGGSLEVNRRRRAHLFFNRSRSMSVEEARPTPTSASASSGPSPTRPSSSLSSRPPAMEWLGPRTVKAFAAAGLLDGERDGANPPSGGGSRYASLRANSEREDRYAPSRAGFSEVASSTSWGRSGSVSRVMTPSESGVTWAGSPTFSVPRTTFSGGSTAPTSISASSSAQQTTAATMQLMKEKHDLETEALLSALSDSQRTTKTLREENSQLRDRIRELEDEVEMMRDQIHRLASGIGPPRTGASTSLSVSTRDRTIVSPTPSLAATSRRHQPHAHTIQRSHSHVPMVRQNASHGNLTTTSLLKEPITLHKRAESSTTSSSSFDPPPRTRQRRASTTSSVFPNLPHNMSMLMLEDTMHDDRAGTLSIASVSPPSPSRVLPSTNGKQPQQQPWTTNDDMTTPPHHHHHPHSHPLHHHYHRHDPTTHPSSMSSSSSLGNISPTTASFSMTEIPGSPTSLQLRPEHELHLGDMASISLYAMSDEEGQST